MDDKAEELYRKIASLNRRKSRITQEDGGFLILTIPSSRRQCETDFNHLGDCLDVLPVVRPLIS